MVEKKEDPVQNIISLWKAGKLGLYDLKVENY